LLSVFLAHSTADATFAHELTAFLETGCDNLYFADDASARLGEDIVATAERGRSADVLVLLLSPSSNSARWVREQWQPVLTDSASQGDTRVAIFLLEQCVFPQLLRRGLNFFNAATGPLVAMRRLKRWLRAIQSGGAPPAMTISPDLESLYCTLADRPGTCTAPGPLAERFAQQAAWDFEAVFWIPAHGRNLTRIAGELGAQLGMRLDGPPEENCRRICEVLSRKRCLVILDAPDVAVDPIVPGGRTSLLFTSEPVRIVRDTTSLAEGRTLVSAGRFAEAYEMFHELFSAGLDTESCARELVWICEHWDRIDEANALRFHVGLRSTGEQLRLF